MIRRKLDKLILKSIKDSNIKKQNMDMKRIECILTGCKDSYRYEKLTFLSELEQFIIEFKSAFLSKKAQSMFKTWMEHPKDNHSYSTLKEMHVKQLSKILNERTR